MKDVDLIWEDEIEGDGEWKIALKKPLWGIL